jgi:hypothetical protein
VRFGSNLTRKRLLLLSIPLVRRLLAVLLLVVLPASTKTATGTATSMVVAATISTLPAVCLVLMELLELVAVFSVMDVLLMKYVVRMIAIALLCVVLASVFLLRLRCEDGRFLALVVIGLALGRRGRRGSGSCFKRIMDK